MKINTIKKMFHQDKLSDWLQYEVYEEEQALYLNADDTIGFMIEIPPIMFAGENVLNGMTAFLEQEWPEDALVQVMLYADPNMLGRIKNYVARRESILDIANESDNFLLSWTEWQAKYLDEHRKMGISKNVPVPFRNFRCFITAKIPITRRELKSQVKFDQISALRDSICGMLKSNNIESQNVHPQELTQLLWQLLNPNHEFLKDNCYDPRLYIRNQVVAPDTELKVNTRRLLLDRHHVAVRIPQVYPSTTKTFNTNQLVGDLMGGNRKQICCPFLLTLNIDTNVVGNEMNLKAEVTAAQTAAMKQLAPQLNRKNEEYRWAASQQEMGKKFIRGYLTLVLFEKNHKHIKRYESMARTVWGDNSYRLQSEIFASLPYFLAALPFGILRPAVKDMNRWLSAPAETHALLAPIQADWRGTKTEGMLFLARRGQLCALDFFDSDSNYNFAVVAPSGSGKSFLVNKVLMENASRGGINFVIDVGKSYKKQCGLLNGQYLEFEEGKNISLNVFSELTASMFQRDRQETANASSKDDLEKRSSLLALYAQLLAVMANPTESATDDEKAILSKAIIETYENLREGEIVEVDDFIGYLESQQAIHDAMGKQEHTHGQLARRLMKYAKHGEYGHWFRGKMNIEFTNSFVVLELEQLNARRDLREVVLLLLISIIEQSFFFGNRSVPKIVLFDEAWDLFRNPNTAAFIETAYRRARKYGASIGTIVQSFLDFSRDGNEAVGQAILSNSEWKLALSPKVEELRQATEENIFSLSSAQLHIASTVKTWKGLYSEVLLISSTQFAAFRFIPTPQELVAFTTEPNEVQIFEEISARITPAMHQSFSPVMFALLLARYAFDLYHGGMPSAEAVNEAIKHYKQAIEYSLAVFSALKGHEDA